MKTLESKLLSPYLDILHAYTTRLDGVSIHGNNLAYHINDIKEDVDKNHYTLARSMQYPLKRLVHMQQVHRDGIVIIEHDYNFESTPTCDALITQEKNIPLMVMVADCIPILIYDPVKKVIATVHAGRTGIFSKILPKTINKMKERYTSNVKDINVSFGPSIHQCCYQVGPEIKKEAKQLKYGYAIKTDDENNYYLDLVSIGYEQLISLGIRKSNIEVSTYCTACNTDTFYSYRAENNNCGRFAGIIMLK